MERPVKTTMPQTPIPPTTGSKGTVQLVTHIPVGGKDLPITQVEDPGPLTAPSTQGPYHPGTQQAPQTPWERK